MAVITVPGFTQTISLAKQTAQGTANLPSAANYTANTGTSIRWLQGSKIRPHMDTKQEQEGDGSRAVSLNFKTGQWGTGKIIFYARPIDAAMVFAAFSGQGSDTHSGVAAPYTHVITPAVNTAAVNYYTLLGTINKGGSTVRYEVDDAVCYKIMASSSAANGPLKLDTDWVGAKNTLGSGAFTPSLPSDGPFYFFNGVWTLNSNLVGANTAWQSVVREISLTWENELNVPDFIAEQVTPLPLTSGNLKLTGDITLLFQDGGIDAAAYFQGGSTDAQYTVQGDLSVTFHDSTDTAQTIQIDIPEASWTMCDFDPDLSGKPIEVKASLVGLRNTPSDVPYTVTITNSANLDF